MLKGVTRRIIEVKGPENSRFERAVLYLRTDAPILKQSEAQRMAEEYLKTIEPEFAREKPKYSRPLKLTVAVLSLSLVVTLSALAVVLVLYTKM